MYVLAFSQMQTKDIFDKILTVLFLYCVYNVILQTTTCYIKHLLIHRRHVWQEGEFQLSGCARIMFIRHVTWANYKQVGIHNVIHIFCQNMTLTIKKSDVFNKHMFLTLAILASQLQPITSARDRSHFRWQTEGCKLEMRSLIIHVEKSFLPGITVHL